MSPKHFCKYLKERNKNRQTRQPSNKVKSYNIVTPQHLKRAGEDKASSEIRKDFREPINMTRDALDVPLIKETNMLKVGHGVVIAAEGTQVVIFRGSSFQDEVDGGISLTVAEAPFFNRSFLDEEEAEKFVEEVWKHFDYGKLFKGLPTAEILYRMRQRFSN